MISKFLTLLHLLGLGCCLGAAPVNLEEMAMKNAGPDALAPGRVGYALAPREAAKPLDVPEQGFPEHGWSLSMWLRLDDAAGNSTILSANRWENFRVKILGGNVLTVVYHAPDGHVWREFPLHLEAGLWYFLTITQDDGGLMKIYLNGRLAGEHDFKGRKPSQAAHIGIIGAFRPANGSIDNRFKGLIDEVTFYNSVLSPEEVANQFEAGNATLPIIPMPRQVRRGGESFSRPGMVSFENNVLSADLTAAELYRRISERIVAGGVKVADGGGYAITLEDIDPENIPGELAPYLPDGALPPDGYLMTVKPDRLTIYSDTPAGFNNGLLSAAQIVLLENIPVCTIFDWPEFPCRAALVVIDSKPPSGLPDWFREQILELAENRFKYMMLRTHDWVMIDDPEVRRSLREVVEYAGSCGITVMPYIQSYSHAKGFLYKDYRFGHTVTVRDETVPVRDGRAVLSKKLVVNTPEIPIIVTAGGRELEEGVDYTVEISPIKASWDYPPEANAQWTWGKPYFDPEQGEAIITFTGKAPAEVTVTYDCFSNGECTCPYSEAYREYLAKCIAAALAITGSDYINLGMDEIWQIRDSGRCCSGFDHTPEQTMAVAFNYGYDCVKAVAPDVKVIIWSDMLDPDQTPPWKVTDATDGFDEYFCKDICMSPWYYGDTYGNIYGIEASADRFLSRGFNLVGTSGKLALNQLLWGESMYRRSLTCPVYGFVYTMWDDSNPNLSRGDGYTAYCQASWAPDRIYIPSLLKLEQYLRMIDAENPTDVQRDTLRELLPAAQADYRYYYANYPEELCPMDAVKRLVGAMKKAEELIR